ncbi:MAG: hypothetical protein RI911_897 [Candidatus Parcubacteria bacterium]|jgi:amidophosphoribosyltransferase
MCGIIGVHNVQGAAATIYDGLHLLQHRGQDAAGICTVDQRKKMHTHRGLGLAHDVFSEKKLSHLKGFFGIGHVRYGTAGGYSLAESQPFITKYKRTTYALAHNGNLVNCADLRKMLHPKERAALKTTSDSELLLAMFIHYLSREGEQDSAESILRSLTQVMNVVKGAYSVVIASSHHGMFAFRDPHGIRPLVLGRRMEGEKSEWMVASESAAFSIGGFTLVRDIDPGEIIFFDEEGPIKHAYGMQGKEHTPCIFEYVYFARPDSLIDDISVHRTRMRLGQKLGESIRRTYPQLRIDAVVPVPESARTAAIELAHTIKVPFREGFVKNRYVGRTFISPGQKSRVSKVRRKLTTLPLELRGKHVLIVDDSIVRGTTIKEIVAMVRSSGAKKVYIGSTAPAVLYENVYGIDIATREELLAVGHDGKRKSDASIAKEIGADKVFYQTIEDLYISAREGNPAIKQFDGSCFDGVYVSGSVPQKNTRGRKSR